MEYYESIRGETLIRTGDIPDKFYVILKGEVMVMKKKDPNSIELEKSTLAKLKNTILKLYEDTVTADEKFQVHNLAKKRHGFSDPDELKLIEN